MVIKVSAAITLLICSAFVIVWSMRNKSKLQLTVKGFDEIGIKLELPYLSDSPGDVIITNTGQHSPLAYKIRWEGIKYSGEIVERQTIKYHLSALLEENPKRRAEILVSNPMLPPQTKWLVGLARETREITGTVPSLEEIGRDPRVFPDLQEYKQINITLDALILEDGRLLGRNPIAFGKEVQSLVSQQIENNKEGTNR